MKKYIYAGLMMVAVLFTSCENFFKTESPSASDVTVFSSPTQTEQVIAGVYVLLGEQNSYRSRLNYPWMSMSTDIETYRTSSSPQPDYAVYSMTSAGNTDLTSSGKHPWAYLTTAIERINICIAGIEQYGDTSLADMRYLYGESLCMRAWLYYEMTKLWGDVPYNFAPMDVTKDEAIYPTKTDRNVIYDKLREDLRLAAKLMPNSAEISWAPAKNNVERMNRQFALGLLARIDLTYAGKALRPEILTPGGSKGKVMFNTTEDKRVELLNEAVWACEEVINADGFSIGGKLLKSYEDVFKNICANVIDYGKTETLWEIPFANNVRGQVLNRSGAYTTSSSFGYLVGTTTTSKSNAKVTVPPTFLFKYEPADQRKWVTAIPWSWSYDNKKSSDIIGNSQNILYQAVAKVDKFSLGKYRMEWLGYEMEGDEDGVNLPIMRYSDILLMYAEASIGSVSEVKPTYVGKYDAAQAFNLVRQRAGLSDKPLTLENLQDERALELCGEHVRKYDLMRWGIFAETLKTAQAEFSYFSKIASDEDGEYVDWTGTPYDGKLSRKVYVKYKQDNSFAKSGDAYVITDIYGLALGENDKPADYVDSSDTGGWISIDPYVAGDSGSKSPVIDPSDPSALKIYDPAVEADLEYKQYWPLFDVILSSNHNLWNDYGY